MSMSKDKTRNKDKASGRVSSADLKHIDRMSLGGLHSSVDVPLEHTGFWKQLRVFVGPAVLVSVGYMDPGNWGTDLQGGAQFKYGLLWVVALASLMAIFLQVISARLGVSQERTLLNAVGTGIPGGVVGLCGC